MHRACYVVNSVTELLTLVMYTQAWGGSTPRDVSGCCIWNPVSEMEDTSLRP